MHASLAGFVLGFPRRARAADAGLRAAAACACATKLTTLKKTA